MFYKKYQIYFNHYVLKKICQMWNCTNNIWSRGFNCIVRPYLGRWLSLKVNSRTKNKSLVDFSIKITCRKLYQLVNTPFICGSKLVNTPSRCGSKLMNTPLRCGSKIVNTPSRCGSKIVNTPSRCGSELVNTPCRLNSWTLPVDVDLNSWTLPLDVDPNSCNSL